MSENYRLILQDKLSRTNIGIAQRYAIRGDTLNAQRFYEQVLRPETSDARSREIIDLAGRAFDENLKRILAKKRYSDRKEMVALPLTRLLEPKGQTPDFSDTVTVTVTRDLFEAPALTRTTANVGFYVKPKTFNIDIY